MNEILEAISANGIQRNLSIMGGEPLCANNIFLTDMIISEVKKVYPDIKIYVWTGHTYEDLKLLAKMEPKINDIFDKIDYLIDGPFILAERDITLAMRGSRNQRILNIKEIRENEKEEHQE